MLQCLWDEFNATFVLDHLLDVKKLGKLAKLHQIRFVGDSQEKFDQSIVLASTLTHSRKLKFNPPDLATTL